MSAVVWNDAYLIGIPEIDDQHREFCNIVRKLEWAHQKAYSRDIAYRLAYELLKYAEFHFLCEENLMLIHGYPGLAGQSSEHKKLIDILQLKLRGMHDGTVDLDSLNKFAFMWFISHTTEEDRKFAVWMRERSPAPKPA